MLCIEFVESSCLPRCLPSKEGLGTYILLIERDGTAKMIRLGSRHTT